MKFFFIFVIFGEVKLDRSKDVIIQILRTLALCCCRRFLDPESRFFSVFESNFGEELGSLLSFTEHLAHFAVAVRYGLD